MVLLVLTPAEFQRECGARLRALIRMLDLTLVAAAEIMGVTKHTLNHWLQGNHPVQPYPLYRLSVAKKVDFNFVYSGDWSRLPYELGRAIEDEVNRKVAAVSARTDQKIARPAGD